LVNAVHTDKDQTLKQSSNNIYSYWTSLYRSVR